MGDRYHFIGVCGIGMSALARIMLQKRELVQGSDNTKNKELEKEGLNVFLGQKKQNISKDLTVIYSSAVKEDNPEYKEAKELACPMLHRSDLLALLMQKQKTLAVAGTHGKTTTSSLLAYTLSYAGYDPSFALGGMLKGVDTNGKYGQGDFFVAEADESDGTHTKYHPFGAIVTNADPDHLDYYKGAQDFEDKMNRFIHQVESSKHLFWCIDDPYLRKMLIKGTSYGFSELADVQLKNFHQKGWKSYFDLSWKGKAYTNISLNLLGKHNVLNAAAVFALALQIGIDSIKILRAFESFPGISRRLEVIGDIHKITVINDYAHHPVEIKTTLDHLREAIKERCLIVILEPHRYSRLQAFYMDYAKALKSADEVIITEVFSASEKPIKGITSQIISDELNKHSSLSHRLIPQGKLLEELLPFLRPLDVVITMGAGSVTKIASELFQRLKNTSVTKHTVGVLCGGQSEEHEISVISSKYFMKNLDRAIYNVKLFGISREGKWILRTDEHNDKQINTDNDCPNFSSKIFNELQACDVVIPILHGPYGEDGMVQGLLETLQIPYVGCSYKSAAICMNKAWTKMVWEKIGLNVAPFITFSKDEFKDKKEKILESLKILGFPLVVKPIHLGSTLGVFKVKFIDELIEKIEIAFSLDTHLIVEEEIKGRELEVGVCGDRFLHIAFPGEIETKNRFYDYSAKYGKNPIVKFPRADISEEDFIEIKKIVKKAYHALHCTGMARLDLFITLDKKIILNEINPLPGCSPNSLFPKVWNNENLSAEYVVDKLIANALYQKRKKQRQLKQGREYIKGLISDAKKS